MPHTHRGPSACLLYACAFGVCGAAPGHNRSGTCSSLCQLLGRTAADSLPSSTFHPIFPSLSTLPGEAP